MEQLVTVSQVYDLIAKYTVEEQLLILQKVQHLVIENSRGLVSSAKLNSGAKAELFACQAMKDLVWNGGENNGVDAVNRLGQGVELKTFAYVKKAQCNAHLTFPKRDKNHTQTQFRMAIWKHFSQSPKYAGGVRIVAMTHSKSIVHHWYVIPHVMLAKIVDAHLENFPDANEYNIGGKVCSKCHLVHRMLQVQNAALAGVVMTSKTDRICRPLKASQIAEGSVLPEIH